MNKLQKTALKHVSTTLKSFDALVVDSVLKLSLSEAGIDDTIRSKIVEKYQTAMYEQHKKVNEAKEWIDALLSDIS